MTFDSWLARLRDRGFVMCPTSSAVPVDVRAVTPGGAGVHFRCRGVRIRLGVYRPGRAAWQMPLRDEAWSPEETLELWENHPVVDDGVPAGARLVFTRESSPDGEIVLDGADARGWRSREAGLLRAAEAAPLFDRMLVHAGLAAQIVPMAVNDTAGQAPREASARSAERDAPGASRPVAGTSQGPAVTAGPDTPAGVDVPAERGVPGRLEILAGLEVPAGLGVPVEIGVPAAAAAEPAGPHALPRARQEPALARLGALYELAPIWPDPERLTAVLPRARTAPSDQDGAAAGSGTARR